MPNAHLQYLSLPAEAHPIARRALLILCATLLIAGAAHISFPLPFTPVPFTLQPLAVLGTGLCLGPVDGAVALLVYLLEGAAYLPVFAPTGLGGPAQLLGVTGGYLLSYPAVAFIAGGATRELRGWMGAFRSALFACTLATIVLFASGASWLAWQTHLRWSQVWFAAILPFIPGEAVKIFAAAGTYHALSDRANAKKNGKAA